jgi:hypothetical protein
MFILASMLAALLCLLFDTTRGFGLILLIVLCLLNPLLLVILMAIGLGIFLYSKLTHKPKTTFLPKE